MKAAEEKIKHKEDTHKTHALLPQSRKILYSNFEHKFDEVTRNLEIEEDDNAKVEYYQYLVVIKSLIFLDQDEEAKISENQEVFEGWKAMKGDVYGFVTRAALKGLMIRALDLQPTSPSVTKRDPSSYNTSKQHTETKDHDRSGIQHTTIDLIKHNESEVRLDSIDENTSSLSKIQNLYKNIKGSKGALQVPVKKTVKNFFSLKLKENQQKQNKRKASKDIEHFEGNRSKFVIANSCRLHFKQRAWKYDLQ